MNDPSETPVAVFHCKKRQGLFTQGRPASVENFPQGERMIELILVTLLYVEKLRQDKERSRGGGVGGGDVGGDVGGGGGDGGSFGGPGDCGGGGRGGGGASESFGLSNPSCIHKPELVNTVNSTSQYKYRMKGDIQYIPNNLA